MALIIIKYKDRKLITKEYTNIGRWREFFRDSEELIDLTAYDNAELEIETPIFVVIK